MFGNNLDIWQALVGLKDTVLTKSPNSIFAKGLTHNYSKNAKIPLSSYVVK